MKGVEVIAEILKREGTEFLSCYPRNPLIEACAKIGIRPVLCRQERVGVGIADGYSRINRGKRIGVFAAQAGPGIENAFPGIAQAYSENVPLLVIPGAGRMTRQFTRPVFDAPRNYQYVTKWTASINTTSFIPDVFRRAYQAMRSGKSGPVLIEVPEEFWEAEFEGPLNYDPVPFTRVGPDPDAVKDAAKILTDAKNPIIFAGQGVLYAEATEELIELANLLPAPVMTTNPGKSAFPENHDLALGASTSSRPKPLADFMNRADVVFAVGSSLTRTPFGPQVPPGKKIVHSTNEPGDINKDYKVDAGMAGDAKLVLQALIAEVAKRKGNKADTAKLAEEVKGARKKWRDEWMPQYTSNEVPINQYRVIWDLMHSIDRDNTIITHDSGSPREQLLPMWETTAPGSYIGWGKSTQLGYGLGINMGAKMARPNKLCINIMGDSAIGMTGMDLETAARNNIGTLTIVFNNGVMAAERDVMKYSTEHYGTLTVGGNYTKVAEGLNVEAIRVEKPDAFKPALKKAVDTTMSGKPFLIECVVKQGYEFSRYN
jgi:acetolactate synthase-1/2/3 large subunit